MDKKESKKTQRESNGTNDNEIEPSKHKEQHNTSKHLQASDANEANKNADEKDAKAQEKKREKYLDIREKIVNDRLAVSEKYYEEIERKNCPIYAEQLKMFTEVRIPVWYKFNIKNLFDWEICPRKAARFCQEFPAYEDYRPFAEQTRIINYMLKRYFTQQEEGKIKYKAFCSKVYYWTRIFR